jgi:3-oxoacyl-(acyl-carrier-protein) synthase III
MTTAILGTGAYVPARRVTNEDLVRNGLNSSHAWILEHTGIHERRVAAPEEASSDLAAMAALRAIAAAKLEPRDIDTVLCATSTPDHVLPTTANYVQARLGCTASATDLNAGCSGFVQALDFGFALHAQSPSSRVLVIGVDTYSRIIDWRDRGSAYFFGDGAGAVVLGPASGPTWRLASVAGSDGGRAESIIVPAGGSRAPVTEAALRGGETKLRMNGRRVWDFAVEQVPLVVREVVRRAGLRLDQIDVVVPHQANAKMLSCIAERLELPPHRLFVNVGRFANTAAASVGIALDEAVTSGVVRPGLNVVLVAFGAGLSWSAVCLRWG